MSIFHLLTSRVGLSSQDVLTDNFSIEQEKVSNEKIEELNLTGIVFNEVEINNCSFIRNDFGGDQFYSCTINKTTFDNCDFTNCEISDTLFYNCTFIDCIFEKCEFYNCYFETCVFIRNNMSWSYHSMSRFINCKIADSIFSNAVVLKCDFIKNLFENNSIVSIRVLESKLSDGVKFISETQGIEVILSGSR